MSEFKHTFSMTPEWRKKFVDDLGCKIINGNMYPSEEIADGSCCFLEIFPDFSVVVADVILNSQIQFTRLPFEDDFWIVYYDLSDNFSRHVVDDVQHSIGYKSKLNFAIIDNQIKSTYLSEVGDRFYTVRLFIRKKYMRKVLNFNDLKESLRDVFDDKSKKMFFYGHIDSRSKVLLYNLKRQNIDSPYYEFLLKSVACNLLAHLIDRLNESMPCMGVYLQKDIDSMMSSQNYLLSNLLAPFPGINFLSNMANMSATKYRDLYKNIFGLSPALFFKNEKMILAKELLESGSFKMVNEVAYELGYDKTSYFSSIYKDYFGVFPVVIGNDKNTGVD